MRRSRGGRTTAATRTSATGAGTAARSRAATTAAASATAVAGTLTVASLGIARATATRAAVLVAIVLVSVVAASLAAGLAGTATRVVPALALLLLRLLVLLVLLLLLGRRRRCRLGLLWELPDQNHPGVLDVDGEREAVRPLTGTVFVPEQPQQTDAVTLRAPPEKDIGEGQVDVLRLDVLLAGGELVDVRLRVGIRIQRDRLRREDAADGGEGLLPELVALDQQGNPGVQERGVFRTERHGRLRSLPLRVERLVRQREPIETQAVGQRRGELGVVGDAREHIVQTVRCGRDVDGRTVADQLTTGGGEDSGIRVAGTPLGFLRHLEVLAGTGFDDRSVLVPLGVPGAGEGVAVLDGEERGERSDHGERSDERQDECEHEAPTSRARIDCVCLQVPAPCVEHHSHGSTHHRDRDEHEDGHLSLPFSWWVF